MTPSPRTCEFCQQPYTRPNGVHPAAFRKRRFCSVSCARQSRHGWTPGPRETRNAIRTFRRIRGRMPEPKELARELNVGPTRIYKILDGLVEAGALTRQPRYVLNEARR